MKVLVTSSTGLTGKAVVKALAGRGVSVRAMIHSDRHSAEMIALGAPMTSLLQWRMNVIYLKTC